MLLLVQIALVAMLFFRLESHENHVEKSLQSAVLPQENLSSTTVAQAPQEFITAGLPVTDVQQLRKIIREELTAVLADGEWLAEHTEQDQAAPIYDDFEMQYQRELVLEEMQALKDQIEVSSQDLEKLMVDIARLKPEDRKDLLIMLNQALNRGEIKGHL